MTRKDVSHFRPTSLPSRARPLLAEHSLVRLASDLDVDRRTIPAGSTGAIVSIWAGGEAYEVEFIEPFHAVVTVAAPQLMQVTPA